MTRAKLDVVSSSFWRFNFNHWTCSLSETFTNKVSLDLIPRHSVMRKMPHLTCPPKAPLEQTPSNHHVTD